MIVKEIPSFLSHLKVDERGYVIPFFVIIHNGKPEFKYFNKEKWLLCTEKNLCWICGKKLIKGSYFFISGPLGLKNRTVTDCAMHRDCAEYSVKICPHMLHFKAERKATEGLLPIHAREKPEFIFVIKASKFKILNDGFGFHVIRFTTVSADKYIYVNNILTRDATGNT
jgi:hypothetical protein